MKNIILYFLILFSGIIYSQDLIVHELNPPNATDYEDLEVLRPLLEDKQVVMLGEMTHMYESIFEMKARVVKYLHEELGFTTLALETSMYDLWRLSKKPYTRTKLNWYMVEAWADSKAFQSLLDYVEKNDIKIVGFDTQFEEVDQFLDDFFKFIEKNKISTRVDADEIGIMIEDILESYEYEEDELSFSRYKRELEYLIREIKKLPNTEENYYWLQFTKNILSESLRALHEDKQSLNINLVDKDFNYRDAQMANNLLSYHKRHPEEKIIVWADNIHVIKDISSYKKKEINEFVSMGEHISKALGNTTYSLATLHANDSLYDNYQRKWFKTPIQENTFESKLLKTNKDYLFVDAHQEALQQNVNSRLLNFMLFYEGRIDQLHDAYIFLKEANIVEEEEEVVLFDKTNVADFKTQKNTKDIKSNYRFSGRLVDAKTKEPIPYVNVMLKDLDIYRLTDADGNYSIQIPNNKEVQVVFSSMNYEKATFGTNQLKEIIELIPSFENLGEVVLFGQSMSPKKVLKKAIQNIENNYVIEPLNFHRYMREKKSYFDDVHKDIEFISKDYIRGYRQRLPSQKRIEQVRWNIDYLNRKEEEKDYAGSFREDAVQFSAVLHKRRYKKFNLDFVISDKSEYQNVYIIKFHTSKEKFNYTNRWYPAKYSGIIYINKDDFAVLKVIQNWESTIEEVDMKKYEYWLGKFKDKRVDKTEYISEYIKHIDGKYYASNYFSRLYSEYTNTKGEFVNHTRESNSILYNYSQENIEVFEFEDSGENANLNRVKYHPEFWENFDLEEIKANSILKD